MASTTMSLLSPGWYGPRSDTTVSAAPSPIGVEPEPGSANATSNSFFSCMETANRVPSGIHPSPEGPPGISAITSAAPPGLMRKISPPCWSENQSPSERQRGHSGKANPSTTTSVVFIDRFALSWGSGDSGTRQDVFAWWTDLTHQGPDQPVIEVIPPPRR